MRTKSLVAAALIVALVVVGTPAQRDFSDVTIKASHMAGKVYVLEGAGGNIGVSVGTDGILIVDDQFAPLAGKIRSALEKIGGGQIAFVLNTHWHGDHTGGNEEFGREAPIIAHTNVRDRLETGLQTSTRNSPPSPKAALPVVTFDASVSIHFNEEEIEVVHFPRGHTDGDCVVFFTGSNVVHMGDDFFPGHFPFVDLETGGSVDGLIQNVGKILQRLPADVKLIPGHGAVSTRGDLEAYHTMLSETTAFVRKRIREGKSLDDVKRAGLPEKWSSWSWSFIPADRWIETIYRNDPK